MPNIPYRNKLFYIEAFNYRGYFDNIDYSKSFRFPNHWTVTSAGNNLSTENDKYLNITGTSSAHFLYTGDDVTIDLDDEYANYGVSLIFRADAGTALRLMLRHNNSTSTEAYAHVDIQDGALKIIESIGGATPSSNVLTSISHPLRNKTYYKLELWAFQDYYYVWLNEAFLLSAQKGTSPDISTDNVGFGFHSDCVHTEKRTSTRIYNVEVFALVPQPEPAYENLEYDLYTDFRKNMQDEIEAVDPGNWSQFNYAHRHWRRHNDVGHSDRHWRQAGYPIRKPTVEEWKIQIS